MLQFDIPVAPGGRLAVGSFIEEYNNKVMVVQLDEDAGEFSARSTFEHPYPTTKIMWIPDGVSSWGGSSLHVRAPIPHHQDHVDPGRCESLGRGLLSFQGDSFREV